MGAFLVAVSAATATGAVVAVPANSTWANLAWGFENGGQDNVSAATLVVDVDLFDDQAMIAPLKAAGHIVICYYSAGSWEGWRPDANETEWAEVKLDKMSGWSELWLDIRKLDVLQTLMGARIDLAASLGCDGIEPDNTDCYDNSKCWKNMSNPAETKKSATTYQVSYNTWTASYAHSKGLAVALKNTLDLVPQLHALYDFAINEECLHYDECGTLAPFVTDGKAILGVAYSWPAHPVEECLRFLEAGISGKFCHGGGNLCSSADGQKVWMTCAV